MKFIFVRHGETDYNLNEIRQGQLDIDLNETGVNQAAKAATNLKDVHFDHVICSDLVRAKHTAQVILSELKSDKVANTSNKLREINLGKWQGLPYADTPLSDIPFTQQIGETGESYHDLYTRISESINKMVENPADITILIVTHKGVIGSIYHMLGKTEEVHPDIPNATPIEIEITEKLEVPVK